MSKKYKNTNEVPLKLMASFTFSYVLVLVSQLYTLKTIPPSQFVQAYYLYFITNSLYPSSSSYFPPLIYTSIEVIYSPTTVVSTSKTILYTSTTIAYSSTPVTFISSSIFYTSTLILNVTYY